MKKKIFRHASFAVLILVSMIVLALELQAKSTASQPKQEYISCSKFSEHTAHVQAKFLYDKIISIKPLDDKDMRLFIINLQDMTSGRRRWVLYDLGPDGSFSADDLIQSHESMKNLWFEGEIGMRQDGKEKLFWLAQSALQATRDTVMSCTLPQCADEKKEFTAQFTLPAGMNLEKISPALLNNRVVLIASDQNNREALKSCSLNPQDNDACSKPFTHYKTHATDILGTAAVRDGIIVYVDSVYSNGYLFSSNPGPSEKIIPLPQGTDVFMMKRVAPGIASVFLIRYANRQNLNRTEAIIMNLENGVISQPIDMITSKVYQMHMIGLWKGKAYTIYEVHDPYPIIYKKEAGQKEREILIGYEHWAGSMKQLANGKVMGSAIQSRVISFDCVP